jgi:hypothetical protein
VELKLDGCRGQLRIDLGRGRRVRGQIKTGVA